MDDTRNTSTNACEPLAWYAPKLSQSFEKSRSILLSTECKMDMMYDNLQSALFPSCDQS